MNDECWTGNHALFSLTLAIPSLILFGIGLPLFSFYRLKMAGHEGRKHESTKAVYGFLFNGYEDKYYGWELTIFARKYNIIK